MSEKRHSSLGIHGLNAHAAAHGIQRVRKLKQSRKYALILLGVLGVGAVVVFAQRIAKAYALEDVSRQQAMRYVTVISPKANSADNPLSLPGTLQGFTEAPIYARTNGYVSRWYKDIGDQVKQGDLLAQLEVPEVEQQLNEAKANLQLAQATFERWDALRKRDAVSNQEFEEKKNTLATATATVKRLQEQVGYSRIVAPFSGVVTRRNIDIGNLVDAGGGSRILFTLAKSDPLRVYIYVPQSYASRIKIGDKAEVLLREMPDETFVGSIVRTSGAIDTVTRTMQVEVNLPNKDGRLLPGAYAQVNIKAKGGGNATAALTLPSNTLLFRPEGIRAAVVDVDGKARLVPVTITRELGNSIEINGLKAEDKVIVNPPDSLADGDSVSVVPEKGAAGEKSKDDKEAKEGGA
jgi:multidrug efflux system membrane fusion protein